MKILKKILDALFNLKGNEIILLFLKKKTT
jgi:hypothetical protein